MENQNDNYELSIAHVRGALAMYVEAVMRGITPVQHKQLLQFLKHVASIHEIDMGWVVNEMKVYCEEVQNYDFDEILKSASVFIIADRN